MLNDEQKKRIENSLAWCKEQRAHALEMVSDYDKGRKDFRGSAGGPRQDVTEKYWKKYAEVVTRMDGLIAAYEKLLED